MKTSGFAPLALAAGAAAALLVGCGKAQPPIGAPNVVPRTAALSVQTDSTNFKTLYSFGGSPDGSGPVAGLIRVDGELYGTTPSGGGDLDYGTVFTITPGGAEKVLYRFHVYPQYVDGQNPQAGLVDVGGTLYGTTLSGGAFSCYLSYYYGCGAVFSVTPGGKENVLHSFGAGRGGRNPYSSLIDVKGKLYGTTFDGGSDACSGYYYGCGTVFSLTLGGAQKVLYQFGGTDGANPRAGLISVGGKLYGTTYGGGAYNCGKRYNSGCGTVFSVTPGGEEKVLHSFGSGSDGRYPYAGLIDVKGTLYGTTYASGGNNCGSTGCGTVFSITLGGTEKVLHSFDGTDGDAPEASLVDVKGTLYGTTARGGAYDKGTVFSITPSGTEKVLHSFDGTDGDAPEASLIDVKGTLYGTTTGGGAHRYGYGTVFSLKP